MSIWNILEINATTDKKQIKKAYHVKLKTTHPEECPDEFMELREAYEKALEYAEESQNYDDWDDLFWETSEEEEQDTEAYEYTEEEESDPQTLFYRELEKKRRDKAILIQQGVDRWMKRVDEVWTSYKTRNDAGLWHSLLYADIPSQMDYYKKCRAEIKKRLFHAEKQCYLSEEVWRLLADFFDLEISDQLVTYEKEEYSEAQYINWKIRLNQNVDFDKLYTEKKNGKEFYFFDLYEELLEQMEEKQIVLLGLSYKKPETAEQQIREQMELLDKEEVEYLPYICIKAAYEFPDIAEEEGRRRVKEIKAKYGESYEVSLLRAQFYLAYNQKKEAVELLKNLYQQISVRNFPQVFQTAIACEQAGLYYEAYMLVKMLTNLAPKAYMFVYAQKIYETMEERFVQGASEANTESNKVRMCRMYLRSNREKESIALLKTISLEDVSDRIGEYHMAKALCSLVASDTEGAQESIKRMEALQEKNQIFCFELEEVKARLLLEEKNYKGCIDACNQMLQRFPKSYSVLLLRSYADWANPDGKYYLDLNYVYNLCKERAEAALLAAKIRSEAGHYDAALHILKPMKKLCEAQYDYLKLLKIGYDDFNAYIDGWTKFWKKVKRKELYILPKEKYNMFNLREIYTEATYAQSGIDNYKISNQFYKLLKSMEESKVNHPEEYMNYADLYAYSGRGDKAVQVWLEKIEELEKDGSEQELFEERCELITQCYKNGDVDNMEKQIAHLDESKIKNKSYYYSNVGCTYHYARQYEKSISYFQKALEEGGKMYHYNCLAQSYYDFGKQKKDRIWFEKALAVIEEGLQICGKSGDLNAKNRSVYELLAKVYIALGRKDKAVQAMEDMRDNTFKEQIKRNYLKYLYHTYTYMYEIEKAYDCLMKIGQNDASLIRNEISEASCLLKLNRYKEAYDILEGLYQEDCEDGDPGTDWLRCMCEADYLVNGKMNMELVHLLKKTLEDNIEEPETQIGEYYGHLSAVYMWLGDEKKAAEYRKKLEEVTWGATIDYWQSTAWVDTCKLWMEGKYEELITYLDDDEDMTGNLMVGTWNYLAKKMIQK